MTTALELLHTLDQFIRSAKAGINNGLKDGVVAVEQRQLVKEAVAFRKRLNDVIPEKGRTSITKPAGICPCCQK